MDNLINRFNHLNLAQQPAQWNYRQLFIEVLNDGADQNAILICSKILKIINKAFGDYGKVNVGIGGVAYNKIKVDLESVRAGNFAFRLAGVNDGDYPLLRSYLTEPCTQLPAYHGGGPGGQGQDAIRLNACIKMVLERINTLIGSMKVKQVLGAHWQNIV